MLQRLRPYMMPVSMTLGAIFYRFFGSISFITPYLIFSMLFLTYCKITWKDLRLSTQHLWLALFQLVGSIGLYLILRPVHPVLAQAAMICVLAPTGTAAPVMTGMLHGNIASITAYSLLINLLVAATAPVVFSFIGNNVEQPFIISFLGIAQHVFLLLILPFVLAWSIRKVSPGWSEKLGNYSWLSFYIWTFSLSVVIGRTVEFMVGQPSSEILIEIATGAIALVISIIQFTAGRKIGEKYNDTIASGQSLGQKNTILAIWMSQIYLHPIVSIAPGSYVLWQNIINSYQIWLETRKSEKEKKYTILKTRRS